MSCLTNHGQVPNKKVSYFLAYLAAWHLSEDGCHLEEVPTPCSRLRAGAGEVEVHVDPFFGGVGPAGVKWTLQVQTSRTRTRASGLDIVSMVLVSWLYVLQVGLHDMLSELELLSD